MEMMKMLREVNVDNNTVGWYQSVYLGTMYTNDVVSYQFSYQSAEDLSDNTIVLMYDPIQSKKGGLVIKAFRLSDQYVYNRRNKLNVFLKPSEILMELPVIIKNAGHVSAFVRSIQDTHKEELDCDFEPLSMSAADTYTERHMEMMNSWLDDLVQEQHKFHAYSKQVSKPRQEHIRWVNKRHAENIERIEAGEEAIPIDLANSGLKPLPEAPSRLDPVLFMGQLDKYCNQVNQHVDSTFHKLYLTAQLHSS
jgi:translation initiation factor 3 subunit H